MKTKNKIDPSHIWDVRDDRLDTTSKALLVRLAGLQHFAEIRVSNGTLAQDLAVSKRTIIEKMKKLVDAGYVMERTEVHHETQAKFTELNRSHIIAQILGSAKGVRKTDLERYYSTSGQNNKKNQLRSTGSEMNPFKNETDKRLKELESDILNH